MVTSTQKTLFEALGEVPDTRSAQGRRHSVQFILSFTAAAMLAGRNSFSGIAQWIKEQEHTVQRAFGLSSYTTPPSSTLHYFFKSIDIHVFETILTGWLEGLLDPKPGVSGLRVISIDGKTLRGSQRKMKEVPGAHLISAYLQHPGCVLRQFRVDTKTNEHKAALELIKSLVLKRSVITGDAMFCQRDLCEAIVKQKGDYFFVVKDNQATLKQAIADAFMDPISPPSQTALAG